MFSGGFKVPKAPPPAPLWTSSTNMLGGPSTTAGTLTINGTGSRAILSINADNGGDAIIKTNKHEINLDKMYEVVQLLSERLMIIAEDPAILEKYPTLKDTYEQYKLLSALMLNDKEDNA